MRQVTTTRTLCAFSELSEAAQEHAIEQWRINYQPESDEISNIDDWQAIAAILGIDMDARRIYWSINDRSEGAAFAGYYAYAKGAPRAIRAYAPLDTELHRIADTLQSAQRRNFYALEARCDTAGRNGTDQRVTVTDARDKWRDCGPDGDAVESAVQDFAHWIVRQCERQYEWLTSDEYIRETIAANEYEFDSEGNLQ